MSKWLSSIIAQMVPVTSRDTWIKQGSNPCFHMMWIRRVIRVALARHCKVEESMRTAAAATGAVPGEGRRERGREGEQFWLQEERKALCRRFSVARAVRSIGLPQLHAAATMARGEGEETAKEREREREKGFPTYVHQNFFIARSSSSLSSPSRRVATPARLFRWLWGIKAGELGTIARGCCGVNWGLLESSSDSERQKKQESFTETRNFCPKETLESSNKRARKGQRERRG